MVSRVAWLAIVLALGLAGRTAAQTPFPEFAGKRLYVSGVTDIYQPLAPEIQRLEKSSPQTYYVVVVESSGSGPNATRNYLDNMYPEWLAQANRQGLTIDPNRSVIILLAEKNRQLSVKMGTLLQSQYGLRDRAIDQKLVQPYFIPHARAGNYLAGLELLLAEIDKAIASKDADMKQAQEQAAARAAEVQRNAEATLNTANLLLPAVRKELAAKQEAGLDVKSLEAQVEASARRLGEAPSRPPEKKLAEAAAAQKQLQGVQAELLQIAARQKEGETLFRQSAASAHKLQEALADNRRHNLATKTLDDQLEATWQRLEKAHSALGSEPARAVEEIQSATAQLAALKSNIDQLPQLARQTQQQFTSIERQRDVLDLDLERARQIGAKTAASQQRIAQLDQELIDARELATSDYQQTLSRLEKLQTALIAEDKQLASQYQQHYFVTRTAPLSAAALGVVLVAVLLGSLRWRHARLRGHVGQRLADFRSEVTHWMERLDALKQRHQMLPFTDEDYTAPMTGQTLSVYSEVQANYEKLRTVWLALMDRRTKAEGVFSLERALGVARLKEVAALLDGREDTTQLQPQFEECVAKLDRLNRAHEEAAKRRQQTADSRQQINEQIERLQVASLPIEQLQGQLTQVDEGLKRGTELLRPDPLTAQAAFEQLGNEVARLSAVCQRRLRCVEAWRAVERAVEETAQRAIDLRARGIKLVEESANPDPVLEDARRLLTECWTALERSDDGAAQTIVEQADRRASQARTRLEKHLADRNAFTSELPKLRESWASLQLQRKQAHMQQQELHEQFAAESWTLVAEHLPQADAALAAMSTALDEAAAAGAEGRQQYSLAVERLHAAEAQRQQAAALIAALGNVLDELKKQRAQATARQAEVTEAALRLAAFLTQHERIVGTEAQRLWSQADNELREAAAGMEQSQPHWPRILAALEQAAAAISAAHNLAKQDVSQHEQLRSELNQVRTRAANIDQLLRSSTADRPRANQRFQGAQQAIAQIAQASLQPQAAWATMLSQLKQAASDLDQAHAWAEEDIRLAAQAAAALRDAEAAYQQSRTYVSFGVTAQMGLAESQLSQAAQRLEARDYEQAISLADSAERAARQAQLDAIREAEERRRRQEVERQRREMQRTSAAALTSASGSSSAFGDGFSSSASHSSSSPSSSSSSSSWSSGTSQSSW